MDQTDWKDWHTPYEQPGSSLSQRLAVVQRHLTAVLDDTAPEPVRVLSVCAGDGRDLLQLLARRGDAERVTATLLESEPRNAERSRAWCAEHSLGQVDVRELDAGLARVYQGVLKSDIVLLAGVFGNVRDADVHRTIQALPALCSPDAVVIWTRHRKEPDLTGAIRTWLAQTRFDEIEFTAPAEVTFTVGCHRYRGDIEPWAMTGRLFTFFR